MNRLFSLAVAVLFAGCATHPKTYSAPDPAKMQASARRMGVAVDKARSAAAGAHLAVAAAVEQAKAEAEETAATRTKLDDLFKLSPAELRPLVQEAIDRVQQITVAHEKLVLALDEATAHNIVLEGSLEDAKRAQFEHSADMVGYHEEAEKLADAASAERAERIKAEKSLSWYRWHWWSSWIVLGLGVAACLFLAFLKFTGRLAISGAAIAAKL